MSPETIPAIITQYFVTLEAMNPRAWAELFTEDALVYDPVGQPPNRAQETAEKFFGLLAMVFEKLQLTPDHVFVSGHAAAVKWTMRGWGKNGKQGVAEGISVFEIHESGRIQQVSSYWDDAAMRAQLSR